MKNIAVIVILVLMATVVMFLVVWSALWGHLTISEGIEVGTLGVLIIVTSWYAYSTHGIQSATAEQVAATQELADISRRATDIALNTTQNAVLPIVTLAPGSITSRTQNESGEVRVESMQVICRNVID